MDNVIWNKCQTPLEKLSVVVDGKQIMFTDTPQEVQEEKDYKVYRHISPNGKIYVGITKLSLSFRWNEGRGYKRCKLFYRAIQKYGWENFKHEVILEGISKSEAVYAEKYLIRWYKLHNISYNITDGGESTTGFHMPEEARRKIAKFVSESHKRPVLQYTINGEFIREFSSAMEASEILGYGRTSVSNCASGLKRENTLHGFIFVYKDNIDSLPQRLKLCKDHWRQYKIVQYQDEAILNIFDSVREAERATGVQRTSIKASIEGRFKQAGGFVWKKVREENIYGSEVE